MPSLEPTTELTVWGHAGVRLERQGRRLAVDPGAYTDARVLDGVTAVLVTHEHADHVEPDALAAVLADRPELEAWAPGPVAESLIGAGAPDGRVHEVAPGDTVAAAGFDVRVLGGRHAVVHPSLPPVANVAYLVDGAVLHPGDSFTRPPEGTRVRVLALPVGGPWTKVAEAADYSAAVAPVTAVPIHDAVLSDAGRAVTDRLLGGLTGDVDYRRLAPGEPLIV